MNLNKKSFLAFAMLGLTQWASALPTITGDQGLHRTEAGQTGGADRLWITLGMEGSWGTDILKNKTVTTSNIDGTSTQNEVTSLNYSTWNLGLALGIDRDWDAGVIIPVHYDGVEFSGVKPSNLSDANGLDLGDLRFWTRHRLPVTDRNGPWNWAVSANGSLNTGSETKGFIPKRQSHVPQDLTQKTAANGASISTIGGGLALTWDGSKVGSNWKTHSSLAGRTPTWLDMEGSWLWGLGAEYFFNESFSTFFEYTGETRWSQSLADDASWISPGVRFQIPKTTWTMSIAADYSPFYDRLSRKYNLDPHVADDTKSSFEAYPTNKWGVSAVISSFWIDLNKDADKDGVVDQNDRCPNTPLGLAVDAVGCPLDTDKDGVLDYLDACPGTVLGAKVDSKGCEMDEDKDGVVDRLDACLGTFAGAQVNEKGCEMDEDQDKVVDRLDLCPGTFPGAVVDSHGCELDSDKDKVVDRLDKCPGTPLGVKVDEVGCPIDSDKDGVLDNDDRCPNTPLGTKVDKKGCPEKIMRDLKRLQSAINFETGSAKLTKGSLPVLDKVAALISEIGTVHLRVEGHTDSTGKAEKNQILSQDRAQSVVDYLISKSVKADLLQAKGFGPSVPVASNKSKEGRAKNRRTEINPIEQE